MNMIIIYQEKNSFAILYINIFNKKNFKLNKKRKNNIIIKITIYINRYTDT